ncbi:histone-like nucleoid-structuring protein Lsr2 [Streptomyces sp. NPDC001902]
MNDPVGHESSQWRATIDEAKRHNQRIRAWAAAQGYPIGDRGRLPRDVVAAFEAAQTSPHPEPQQLAGPPAAVPHPHPVDPQEVPLMVSALSAPARPWDVLLPWLDRLAPSELLALQRLGGPAQWWLRETPQETSARREDLGAVFDLLASCLEIAPLAYEPLSSLLPQLSVDRAIADLDAAPKTCTALAAVAGGATLDAIGTLSPHDILTAPIGSHWVKHDALAVLVREGVLLSTPRALPQDSLPEPVGAAPAGSLDDAVAHWFEGLDPRQQDLIVHHVSAASPSSVDLLATRHRTMRERMTQLLEQLPDRLAESADADPRLHRALELFQEVTSAPICRADIVERHPWTASTLIEPAVTVLDVLAAVVLSAREDDKWLYAGSVEAARAKTLEALDLDPAQYISLNAAARLLAATGEPLRPTEDWLHFCGLRLVGNQVERRAEPASDGADSGQSDAAGADYELAPPQPNGVAAAWPQQSTAPHDTSPQPPAIPSPATSSTPPPPAESATLARALDELHRFAAKNRPDATLADLLQRPEQLPRPLRGLVLRLLAAETGPSGWVLPAEPPPAVDAAAHKEPALAEEDSLADALAAILSEAKTPLMPGEALYALLDSGALAEVSAALAADPRILVTASGQWSIDGHLHDGYGPAGTQQPREPTTGPKSTLKDQAWAVLREAGHPLTFPLLVEGMGTDVNARSLKAQLPTDSRFLRSDIDSWALAEWGLRRYTSIKNLVAEEVDRAGGEIATADLVAVLTREFSIKESSLIQVASTPPFTTRGGVVRRLDAVHADSREQEPTSDGDERSHEDGPSTDDLIDLMGL